jgi:hypothetical protein
MNDLLTQIGTKELLKNAEAFAKPPVYMIFLKPHSEEELHPAIMMGMLMEVFDKDPDDVENLLTFIYKERRPKTNLQVCTNNIATQLMKEATKFVGDADSTAPLYIEKEKFDA